MESQSAPSVWVDDTHAIVRRGIVGCLAAQGFAVVGESVGLEPAPRLDGVDVLGLRGTSRLPRHGPSASSRAATRA